MKTNYLTILSTVAMCLCSINKSEAASVVGGNSLLTNAYLNQLESQLSEGELVLTNIFTKSANSTSADFHSAVDGQGRTFVVMQATENSSGNTAVVGGYNPQTWSDTDNYHVVNNPTDRTAFIFNLTLNQFFSQRVDAFGEYQTFNRNDYGPTFGAGHDLYVDSFLNSGYSWLRSYGSATAVSIVDGSSWSGLGATYGAIEVFTITPVPIPGAAWLFNGGIAALEVFSRRKKNKKTKI